MNKILKGVGALVCAMVFLMGGLSSPALAQSKEQSWTILIYMNGKNNLEPFAISNFQELAKVGSTAKVKFVVQMGRPLGRAASDPMRNTFGGWSGAKRYLVTAGMNPDEKSALMTVGTSPAKVDMGDPDQFEDFLRWGKAHYPADRYVVVVWNHGQGYRIILADAQAKALPATQLSIISAISSPSTYRSVSYDGDTRSILYNVDVKERLGKVFTREELAAVGFDACLMAMVETAYELSSTTPLLLGSEELEPGRGWNYTYVADKLTANPAMTDNDFAQTMVDMYRDRYGNHDETTFSALDLNEIPTTADDLSQVASVLSSNLKKYGPMIEAARSGQNPYNISSMPVSIDAYKFLDLLEAQLVEAGGDTVLLPKVRAAKASIQKAVIANYASDLRQGGWGSYGLAIYFPEAADIYRNDPDGMGYMKANQYKPISFVREKAWADFLALYYSR